MISEIEFIREHTSFWRTISPLSEDFVRHINIHVLDRAHSALNEKSATSRRALINEVSFRIFCRSAQEKKSIDSTLESDLKNITEETVKYISGLRDKAPNFDQSLNVDEVQEIKKISEKLFSFFKDKDSLILRPEFSGCGKLDTCYGDVITGDTLYEIKSGGRAFRSLDLRQLILYLSLNRLSGKYEINNLALYNPRQGFHFKINNNEFSMQFSGLSSEELCHRVSYELTQSDMNRFIS
ncbi:hypothetical protein [Micavibrio aeruginosavorus]|uniref:hypothetical protein n=1 Tax=Micavibrio aeruginosavorus TaxID=349221 RepID=UPI003F4AC09C